MVGVHTRFEGTHMSNVSDYPLRLSPSKTAAPRSETGLKLLGVRG